MPYASAAQARFMHMKHPDIAKKWDAEAKKIGSNNPVGHNKVYKTGSPVAHKNMKLNPTGYVNREVNKGRQVQRSTHRSGLAKMGLKRAAQRRQAIKAKAPRAVGVGKV